MEQKQMTVNEAIQLIENATGMLKLDRNEHTTVIVAINTIKELYKNYEALLVDVKKS
jgi:hypothetical protein